MKRVLLKWNCQSFSVSQLNILLELEKEFNEIIIIISHSEEAFTKSNPLCAGERMEYLNSILKDKLKKTFYILPVFKNGLSYSQFLSRIKILSPDFSTIICHNKFEEEVSKKTLKIETRLITFNKKENSLYYNIDKINKRGIFITKAQFFHNGHAAYVEKILRDLDELIVVVAMANFSHTLNNPATGGERLEMIKYFLDKKAKGKYYLAAVPYSDYNAANFYDLQLLFPSFEYVYTSNPEVIEIAKSSSLTVRGIDEDISISSTYLRETIINNKQFKHLVPKEIYEKLVNSPALKRLINLSLKEKRGGIL